MRRLRSEPLFFVLVLSAALLIFLHQLNVLKPFENIALLMLSPVQEAATATFGGVAHFFGGFRDAADWRQKFEERQALIDQLLVDNTQLREKEKENETLREMLSFKQ
ncbi:MAG TPA: hypothetical protein VGQ96_00325, partial [Candidatus Eremiobacteraceae bacterium]|nr:hypothetical protein [Candidatus Eremiobacteraceae bacterium]